VSKTYVEKCLLPVTTGLQVLPLVSTELLNIKMAQSLRDWLLLVYYSGRSV